MTTETELKPCPFCGGEADWISWLETPEPTYFIECKVCEAQGPLRDTLEQAIAAWNHRA